MWDVEVSIINKGKVFFCNFLILSKISRNIIITKGILNEVVTLLMDPWWT